jgi:putative membrane protein
MTDHTGEMTGGPGGGFWILNGLLVLAALYAVGVHRLAARGDRWPRSRSLAAVSGVCCLVLAVLPAPVETGFAGHVVQHLLLAMLAPLFLALSAPITLALRTAPVKTRRLLVGIAHRRIVLVLMTAPAVLVLNVGGLYAYYLTPFYDIAHLYPWVQAAAHLHMFLAGCLLSWYLIGRDPISRRPTLQTSLIVLLFAAASHDLLAKILYANQIPSSAGTPEQIQVGAQIMYYGGFATELVLAVLVMVAWYRRSGRQLDRERRRQALAGHRHAASVEANTTDSCG